MKAIVCTLYGSPDVLERTEVDQPTPGDDEALVEIVAASLNAADLEWLRGTLMIRLTGLLKPKYQILGSDIAGRVAAVGRNVTQFQPGDEVFGDLFDSGLGAFAEYVCAPEHAIARKPASMTFEEAATYPQAAIIALQSLRDTGQIRAERQVLINGAGGGMGTFTVQIAKSFRAEVTDMDHAGKLDMLRAIGADHVIDYTREDYARNAQQYDLILDVAARRSIFDYRRALSIQGTGVIVGESGTTMVQAFFLGPLISRNRSQKLGINT